jgi:hypothetical protein
MLGSFRLGMLGMLGTLGMLGMLGMLGSFGVKSIVGQTSGCVGVIRCRGDACVAHAGKRAIGTTGDARVAPTIPPGFVDRVGDNVIIAIAIQIAIVIA